MTMWPRLLLAVALVASVLSFSPADASSQWQLVGTHPDAAAQPTARGKILRELHAYHWGGTRIYIGFGDYGENTGPIRITPWNVGHGWQNEGSQDTEEIDNFQEINGILFSPSIDPAWRGDLELGSNQSDYANINGLRQWPDSDRMDSYHVFDIRQLGNSIVASGSSPGCNLSCATIWRSDNGGANFYIWYRSTRDASQVYGGDRCYHLATYGSKVWANCTSGRVTFNGSWTSDSAGYGHKESVHFNGALVTPGRGGALYAFNGTERILRSGWHKWLAVDGGDLYAVDVYNRVYRSSDLSSWTQVASIPSEGRSFTVGNGVLYYGDTNSRLWSLGSPVVEDTTTSTTTTVAPTTTSTTTTTAPVRRRCFLICLGF